MGLGGVWQVQVLSPAGRGVRYEGLSRLLQGLPRPHIFHGPCCQGLGAPGTLQYFAASAGTHDRSMVYVHQASGGHLLPLWPWQHQASPLNYQRQQTAATDMRQGSSRSKTRACQRPAQLRAAARAKRAVSVGTQRAIEFSTHDENEGRGEGALVRGSLRRAALPTPG
jgi:hypothetical protein